MKRKLKLILGLFLSLIIALSSCLFSFAENENLLYDEAELLSAEEFSSALSLLNAQSEEMNFAFAVVTVNDVSSYGYDQSDYGDMQFADDYMDNYDLGYPDGALLLIDMDTRYCYISTMGYGIEALTDYGIDYILDGIWNYITAGDYYSAITEFINITCTLVEDAKNGEIFDYSNTIISDYLGDGKNTYSNSSSSYNNGASTHSNSSSTYNNGANSYNNGANSHRKFNLFKALVIALIIGVIVALIVTGCMKNKLKSVRMQRNAVNYIVPGSLNLTSFRDLFLYSNVVSTPKPRNDTASSSHSGSSHSGSSSHSSHSGASHGGGGRHF